MKRGVKGGAPSDRRNGQQRLPRASRQEQVAVLDQLARTIVMLRANAALVTDEGRRQWWGSCQRCLRPGWLCWCHIFTRGAKSVRWDPLNAWAWCRGCHRHMDQHWDEKLQWIIERIGEAELDRLRLRKETASRLDYALLEVALKEALKGGK